MNPAAMTPEQRELVLREFNNHASFCRSSLLVETEAKTIVPMELSPGQIRLDTAIRKQRLKGVPVRLVYLKSRRIQATTGTASHYFYSTAFTAGVHSAVLGHNETSSEAIFSIYRRFHEKYRPFAGTIKLPKSRVLADRIYYEYGGDPESSFLQVKTAGSTNFGRGFRLTNIHFSEFPYYEKPGEILTSIMSAVPKLPDTCAIIEGTAKTVGDLFHRMWQQSMDPSSDSDWVGLFMGWWEHPSNRMPLLVEAGRFQDSLSREEREIMARFGLDLLQMNWRRWTIANDCGGDISRFKREHPATPEEAFTASSRNRFSIPHINRMPIIRNAMAGEIRMENDGERDVPVFTPNDHGAVRIYRMPERGKYYACGADPSGGSDVGGDGQSDPDFAVAHIFDRESREQVAVLRARMMPGEFGRYIFRLLLFYNRGQVAVEKTGVGIATLETLLNEGYPAALIYHRPVTVDQDPITRSDKIGWNTDPVSREQLLSALDEVIRANSIFVHDPVTQQELLTFVISARGKAEAQAGCHDDTVMALGLAVIVMSRMPMPVTKQAVARPEIRKYGQPAANQDRRGTNVRLR